MKSPLEGLSPEPPFAPKEEEKAKGNKGDPPSFQESTQRKESAEELALSSSSASPLPIFELIHELHEEPIKKTDWRKIANSFFFVSLVVLGALLLFLASNEEPSLVFGTLLLSSGLTPFMLSLWAFASGWSERRRQNMIRIASSSIFVASGITLLIYYAVDQSPKIFGNGFFGIGILFFISKLFFLVKDDDFIIKELQEKLKEALASPSYGLACSYYYNFVLPIAGKIKAHCKDKDASFRVPVEVETAPREFVPSEMVFSELLVIIPRELDSRDGIKETIIGANKKKKINSVRVTDPPGSESHRPMFLATLAASSDLKTVAGLFDIPTVISAIWDRKQNEKEVLVDVRKEIRDFQNSLFKMVQGNPLTADTVRIISVPHVPSDWDQLKKMVEAQILLEEKRPPEA